MNYKEFAYSLFGAVIMVCWFLAFDDIFKGEAIGALFLTCAITGSLMWGVGFILGVINHA